MLSCNFLVDVGQVAVVQPAGSVSTLLPMVLFQNVSPGPPNSVLQVAVKNNQQPVWYFVDKIPLQVLFMEDGHMERGVFLEVFKLHLFLLDLSACDSS
jgi:AP-1 complex subunit beta-1